LGVNSRKETSNLEVRREDIPGGWRRGQSGLMMHIDSIGFLQKSKILLSQTTGGGKRKLDSEEIGGPRLSVDQSAGLVKVSEEKKSE